MICKYNYNTSGDSWGIKYIQTNTPLHIITNVDSGLKIIGECYIEHFEYDSGTIDVSLKVIDLDDSYVDKQVTTIIGPVSTKVLENDELHFNGYPQTFCHEYYNSFAILFSQEQS